MSEFKIDINKEVTSRLGIQPEKTTTGGWKYDGLCPIVFQDCHITTQTFEKGQFAGLEAKVLNFEFTNVKLNSSDPERFLTHQEKVIGTQKKEGEGYVEMDEKAVTKLITAMWGRVKHILDSCKGLANHREIAQDKNFQKLIAFPTTNDAAVLIKHYNEFYQFICDFVNGDGKTTLPIYKAKDGSFVKLWAKVLPAYPDYKWYAFPGFVGQGFLERIVVNDKNELVPAKIVQIKPGETLELAQAKKGNVIATSTNIAPGAIPADIANLLGIK